MVKHDECIPDVVTSQFVGLVDALCVPVRPEDGVFENGDGEGMRQTTIHHSPPPRAIQAHALDDVVLRIGPVRSKIPIRTAGIETKNKEGSSLPVNVVDGVVDS